MIDVAPVILAFAHRVEFLANGGGGIADLADHVLKHAFRDAKMPRPLTEVARVQSDVTTVVVALVGKFVTHAVRPNSAQQFPAVLHRMARCASGPAAAPAHNAMRAPLTTWSCFGSSLGR